MTIERDLTLIHQAIQKELSENPFCPVVSDLYAPLLEKINQGDKEALQLALQIAHDTLASGKSLFPFLKRSK